MKKFIQNILLFLLSIIIFLVVFDYSVSFQLREGRGSSPFWRGIFSGDLKNDVVIMGSSRAKRQFNPYILDSMLNINSYNMGVDGRFIKSQILTYNAYQRSNGKPKFIIQNIDYSTIDTDNAFEREMYFPYFNDKTFRNEVVEIESLSLADKYMPGIRYSGYFHKILLKMKFKNRGRDIDTKGFVNNYTKWDGSLLEKLTEIDYSQDSLALYSFDKYLSKAYSDNIKIIFVYSPIYIGATKKIKNIEGMYQMYDSIAKKYDIPILDYNYDAICYDTIYFYNATHLNRKGADLFSLKFANDIDSLGLLKEKN